MNSSGSIKTPNAKFLAIALIALVTSPESVSAEPVPSDLTFLLAGGVLTAMQTRWSLDGDISFGPHVSPLWFQTGDSEHQLLSSSTTVANAKFGFCAGPYFEPTILLQDNASHIDYALISGILAGGYLQHLGIYAETGVRGVHSWFWGGRVGLEGPAGSPYSRMGVYATTRVINPNRKSTELWLGLNFQFSFNSLGMLSDQSP